MGHAGQRAGTELREALRLGNRAQRAYPSGDAKGGGERGVSHGDVYGISAAGARKRARARTDEGSGRASAQRTWRCRGWVRSANEEPRGDRRAAGQWGWELMRSAAAAVVLS